MTLFTIILLLLLCAIAAVSAYRIVRLPLSVRIRALFLLLRLALLAAIAAAFIEPAIVLERLSRPQRDIPVLIDGSKSMRLFSPDSTAVPLLSAFTRWNAASGGGKRTFHFFLFGDSLRKADPRSSFSWSDRRSLFPETWNAPEIRDAGSMVLITDGNWSNASKPDAAFTEKNVWYLPLNSFHESPWLQLDIDSVPDKSIADSPLVVRAVVQGVVSRQGGVTVTVREKNRTLGSATAVASQGYFKHEARINLPGQPPGRHLCRFDVSAVTDSLMVRSYRLHYAVPGQYSWTMPRSTPSLDRRFIRTALGRRSDFIENESPLSKPSDLLIVFNGDSAARKMASMVKPQGAVLYIGCLPCPSLQTAVAGPITFFRPPAGTAQNPFDNLDVAALPPLSQIPYCKKDVPRPRDVFITARVRKTGSGATDTIDCIYTGRTNGMRYIVCAVTDLWRWDFLPLAVAPDEERIFSISDRLLTLAGQVLSSGLSDGLLLYPAGCLAASDSLRFHIAFPAAIPIPTSVRLTCAFSGDRNQRYDTSFVITVTGSVHQSVSIRPLEPGVWRLEAEAMAGKSRYRYSDSVAVNEDRSEYMIKGQNVTLLDEIAQPLNVEDSALPERLFSRSDAAAQPVKETFHISRGWPLLVLIFLLFGAEWILRRMFRLD
jgi:hypothetical protein